MCAARRCKASLPTFHVLTLLILFYPLKYSKDAEDRHFTTVIFTSDSDRAARYADEGRLDELCRWTVDLSALPSFRLNAESGNQGGFFTEFELGLELDSAEARGVLLVGDQEWGQVVFDFYD